MWLVQKIMSYEKTLTLKPKKPKQSIKKEKGSIGE
jgi:hypothetical protein